MTASVKIVVADTYDALQTAVNAFLAGLDVDNVLAVQFIPTLAGHNSQLACHITYQA